MLFVIALRLGSRFVMWALSPNKNPILVPGYIPATEKMVILWILNLKVLNLYYVLLMKEKVLNLLTVYGYILLLIILLIKRLKRHIFNKGSAQNVGNKPKFGDNGIKGMNVPK